MNATTPVRLAPVLALALLAGTASVSSSAPSHPDLRSGFRSPTPIVETEPRGAAVLNTDSGLGYASIQAAVAAATPGDELVVQAPVLEEGLVTIDRAVVLRGETGAEVVRASVDTTDSGDGRGWFLVEAGVEVEISDLRFEAPGRQIFQALRVRGTGTFRSLSFASIRFGDYQGVALTAFGDGPVTVEDSSFEGIGRLGVFLFGPGVAASVVRGNTFVGKGDGLHLDYPIELGGGASASILGNRVSNARGVAIDDSVSAAVLLSTTFGPGTDAVLEGNQFVENSYGILLPSGDGATYSARFNRFVDNGTGVGHFAAPDVDLTWNWWGCNGGVGSVGCDTVDAGTAGGAWTADPWLTLTLALDPGAVLPGQTLSARASLIVDSEGFDTSGTGQVADGIPISFASSPEGSIAAPVAGTLAGTASTDVEVVVAAPGNVLASLDSETVSAPFGVLSVVDVPTLDVAALVVLVLLLAGAAATRLVNRS